MADVWHHSNNGEYFLLFISVCVTTLPVCCLLLDNFAGLYSSTELQTIAGQGNPGQTWLTTERIEAAFRKYLQRVKQFLHVVVCLRYSGNENAPLGVIFCHKWQHTWQEVTITKQRNKNENNDELTLTGYLRFSEKLFIQFFFFLCRTKVGRSHKSRYWKTWLYCVFLAEMHFLGSLKSVTALAFSAICNKSSFPVLAFSI